MSSMRGVVEIYLLGNPKNHQETIMWVYSFWNSMIQSTKVMGYISFDVGDIYN